MMASLDHIVLGSSDLERGIAWLEDRTGVRASVGGAHPGRGTHNALLQLGSQGYLEILAPDPQQSSPSRYPGLHTLEEPRLIAWAARSMDIEAQAKMARAAGFAIIGPENNSRTRPDGRILHWRFFRLQNDRAGLLPFFIEWSRDSVHPSEDAPAGCRLDRFFLESQASDELCKACRDLGLEVVVEHGEKSLLRARISAPKGEIELTSRGR
jgi:glyoxalase-like protein